MHLTLLDVREATEQEVQAGSIGEPLFMVQTGAPPDEPVRRRHSPHAAGIARSIIRANSETP